MGFDAPPDDCSSQSLPAAVGDSPFVLYLGRKETGKNVGALIEGFLAFRQAVPTSAMRLVICGGGDFSDLGYGAVPPNDYIIDVAHVSELEKQTLLSRARVLCQPSRNESFSIVLMEAWLRNCPVLVDARCEVTREHVLLSGGGLYAADVADYVAVFKRLEQDQELGSILGSAGRRYVQRVYNWDAVMQRFYAAIDEISACSRSRHAVRISNGT
jgi:glycosyltransferase involved in cell wall biosynthesis